MSEAIKKKKFTLWVYKTLTGQHEEVEVYEEVYRIYKRTQWNIEKMIKSITIMKFNLAVGLEAKTETMRIFESS